MKWRLNKREKLTRIMKGGKTEREETKEKKDETGDNEMEK